MSDLTNRLEILEALVARLLRERTGYRPDPPDPVDASMVGPPEPLTTLTSDELLHPPTPITPELPHPSPSEPESEPMPHPDWLPIIHSNGSSACGRPGVYLTQRASGVHTADPTVVRILPRLWDPLGQFWIVEPYRAPISTDRVLCASCTAPIALWSGRDLDYRPYLDDEIGQPLYRKAAQQAAGHTTVQPTVQAPAPPIDEEQLLRLKEQARALRDSLPDAPSLVR